MDDAVVLFHRRAARDTTGDRTLLVEAAARLLGRAASDVLVTRHCPRCGVSDHGQPRADGVYLSLSRADDLVAVLASLHGPVGIDIESLERIAVAGFDDVAFTPAERAAIATARDPGAYRAMLWTSKEALLKATGRGLTADPLLLHVGGSREVLDWPESAGRPGTPTLEALAVPAGFVGTMARLSG
jgi:4'-phosphopantetheinyl transferase